MFFTLIIPAYNCEETIDRAMISLVNQNFNDLKIIVIDDSDEDRLCQSYINKYKDKLNIDYFIRRSDLYSCHCPGNTRHDGLLRALQEDTQYIFFMDDDDEFFPNSFQGIYDFLIQKKCPNVIYSGFWTYKEETGQQLNYENVNISWLHGKFYKKDFLLNNDIQFQVDLASHEDVYFNSLIKCYLTAYQESIVFYDKIIYKWYHRKTSASHYIETETGQNFLETHFADWMNAVFMPIEIAFHKFPAYQEYFKYQIVSGLTLAYFYSQSFIYNSSDIDLLRQNFKNLKNVLTNIMYRFNLSKQEIINIAYQDFQIYNINRAESIKAGGSFVEQQSFQDFINTFNIYQ